MKRFLLHAGSFLLAISFLLPCLSGCQKKNMTLYNESYIDLFDTVCTFYGAFETVGEFSAVSLLVKEELTRLDALFDGYEEKSDQGIYAINAAAGISPVRADEELFTILSLALEISELTNGAFSPTMGAVTKLWKKATEEGVLPQTELLMEAGQHIDPSALKLNRLSKTIYLNDSAASIDLGAFAKGYAADRIAILLAENGCENYLLDLGGNIYAKGNDPQTGLPFLVGVADPTDSSLSLPSAYISDGALVTSGSDQRSFWYEGKNYHHIISPETLKPVENSLASVTVLQNSAALADALSTALFVLGEEEGKEILKITGGEALFVKENGEYSMTDGFATANESGNDRAVFLFLLLLLAVVIALYLYRNIPKKQKNTQDQPNVPSAPKMHFGKKDIVFFVGSGAILIICFLVIAFSGILETHEAPEAVIRQNGEEICRLSLAEDQIYRVGKEKDYNIIAICDGQVYIYAADCPNEWCAKSKPINSMSLPAVLVCLPHRLTVTIE